MRLSRLALAGLALLVVTSCKIRIIVPEGGGVATSSGAYSCTSGKTCDIDVVDFFFDQTFIAKPATGYIFKYWKKGDRRFCGGASKPCRLFTTAFTGDWVEPILEWLETDEVFYLQPVFEVSCDGYQTPLTIAGTVNGDILTVTVSDRFAGAVESVKWRGKEFINIWDHGRQISYAWSLDNWGECLNPTEPGSARDYKAASSTSVLQSACKAAPNILSTRNRLAYWLGPGETGYCSGGATTAVNKSLVSDQVLRKTITIGYQGLENVIAFDAVITNPNDHSFMAAEIPTAYLTYEFSRFWIFNPQTGELTMPESEPLQEPWSFQFGGQVPPIISTSDGAYAMGAYYPGPDRVYYGLFRYDSLNQQDKTSKWNMVIHEDPYPAGTYHYESFAIVGSLEQVQAAMIDLYKLHPTDITIPEGHIDVVDCNQIAGWSWDAGEPNRPLKVAIYDVDAHGKEILVTTVTADIYRIDLKDAQKGNGVHGFAIATPGKLLDGRLHTIRAYGVNPDPKLAPGVLYPPATPLKCS
ncbi:MAG: hypothetical protein KDI34_02295 [Halioglobus sp.]|nr:hypothetical protein [Halioglobus sp.]